jgi:hypothetical protein
LWLMSAIERLAEGYLNKRGRVVLPRVFTGVAFGHCVAIKTGGDETYDHWDVITPKEGRLYALNNCYVEDLLERGRAR